MKQIFAGIFIFSSFAACQPYNNNSLKNDYTHYVNAFIGTAEYGHCFPNACVPFGLIQTGPETGNCSWDYCAGYQYKDLVINGFSQTRLNGTGVPDLGDLLVLPFTGDKADSYTSRMDKTSEKASPGYYSVILPDDDIETEMTATSHVALHRYTYNKGQGATLMIDFQSAQVSDSSTFYNHVKESQINFEDQTTITGFTTTDVWVKRTYYYVIRFNKPIARKLELPKRNEKEKASRYVFNFDLNDGDELMMKISISAFGIDGAKANLSKELDGWDFDDSVEKAKAAWNDLLARVEIEGDKDRKTMFYTLMYRLFIQPNNIADAGKEPFYSTLSLWDTYRAAHPLYTILSPEKVDGFVNSMLRQYDEQGFLPIWALWGKENYCMIANHAVPVIADAFLKGFEGFDKEKAYEAIKASLTTNHQKSDWQVYDEYGYYPFDIVPEESVSRTLESAYDDYCAAKVAKAFGKEEDYRFFSKRSNYYKNLFDPETKLMRGKDSKGHWRKPFNALALSHAGTAGGDYTEGNAWQYTWHVQQNVHALIDLMGGKEKFTTKLDSLFSMSDSKEGAGFVLDVTGLIGQYAHGNEPSHHVAYLYILAGKPWRTQELVYDIVKTKYVNEVNGLCGNDDCGQMSAWYIFANLGFYPVNPCGGEYVLGAPQIEKATIKLPGGKIFTVTTENFSDENIYVDHVELNGGRLDRPTILHSNIVNGGSLKFFMTNAPQK